jgi:acetyl-CoA C-acetyltransferase
MVLGNVIHTEAKDMYISRVACLKGGLPQEATALTVNRLCGSGLQAILSAAQMIQLGDTDVAVGGGVESMSRGGYLMPTLRWGQRMNDGGVVDMMVGALTDPFDAVHMGITAENIAEQWKITREQQDEFAVESHRRAVNAMEKGYFKDQILPIEMKTRKGTVVFDKDEHPRSDATVEGMAKLRAVFKKDGSVTAGNASGINDGAAAVVLMERKAAEKQGIKPMGRLVSYGIAGVDPKIMGIGPVPASKIALEKAGLKIEDMDVIEANEAFAVQAMAVACDLKFDPKKTNPNGGAVGLGHPIGATGALITVKALYELQRIGGKYALVTMCIGGGRASPLFSNA